ncbi:MAG: LysE family transporter [Myxococcaceae bacterium]
MEPEIWKSMAELAGIIMLGAMSPGPDFAIVVKNSLIYSRNTALWTALGISLGNLVHVSYTLLGLGLVISENPWLFQLLKYLGASYLVYIGWHGIRAQKRTLALDNLEHQRDLSWLLAVRSGFLTALLNPKSMLFFISLFSVVIPQNTSVIVMFLDAVMIFVESLLWFSFLAYCLSGQSMREKFNSISHWIERLIGGVLILLGVKLFFHDFS